MSSTLRLVAGEDPNGDPVNLRQGGYKDEFTTNTPLGSSVSFNSGIVDLDSYQFLKIECASDQDGTIVGEWYDDALGTNVIRTFALPYDASGELLTSSAPMLARYVRLTYTNGSVAQAYFWFRLRISEVPYSGQIVNVDSFIPTNIQAQVTRSVLVGLNDSGIYNNVQTNDVGALNTSDFILDVIRGRYPKYAYGTKFGRNDDIDTGSDPEDVWNGGGVYTGFPTTGTATTLEVVSDDAADTAAGTGARTVRLIGLDANYNRISEDVTLNGSTAVTTVNSYWRMTRAYVLTAGSDEYNQGEITASWTGTPAQVFMVMPAVGNQTAICCDTVPAGKTRVILQLYATMSRNNGSAGSCNVRFQTREENAAWRTRITEEVTNALTFDAEGLAGIILPEKTDMKWRVESVSDNNTQVTAEFKYIDIDN